VAEKKRNAIAFLFSKAFVELGKLGQKLVIDGNDFTTGSATDCLPCCEVNRIRLELNRTVSSPHDYPASMVARSCHVLLRSWQATYDRSISTVVALRCWGCDSTIPIGRKSMGISRVVRREVKEP
jgi:hypothetical protein